MKKKLLALMLVAGSSAFAGVRFGVGVNIGAPVVVAARPAYPGPGYVWVDGYTGPSGFVAGYWALPPNAGAFWVAPRFVGGRFAAGYWGRPGFHEDFRFRGREFGRGFRR